MKVVNLLQVHSFTEGGCGETWKGWRQVKKLRNQVKHLNCVPTISTLIFSESSWSEEEVQAKVGKLELNSYELHNTVTGGFRFELSRLIFTWNSTSMSSITPPLGDSRSPVKILLQDFCFYFCFFSRASFPLSLLLNHSCLPNCIHMFTRWQNKFGS